MGSLLTSIAVNFYMECLKIGIMDWCPTSWHTCTDYVDTFVIQKHGMKELQNFLQHLNNTHP